MLSSDELLLLGGTTTIGTVALVVVVVVVVDVDVVGLAVVPGSVGMTGGGRRGRGRTVATRVRNEAAEGCDWAHGRSASACRTLGGGGGGGG